MRAPRAREVPKKPIQHLNYNFASDGPKKMLETTVHPLATL